MADLYYLMIVVLALGGAYYLGIFTGAHYVPTTDKTVQKMLRGANLKEGEKLTDLGSGDGKILIAAAQMGAIAYGYEINPVLVLWSRARIRRAGLAGKAFVYWKSFWRHNFSDFDVVTVYGIPHIMGLLEKKLEKELKPGARVVCNSFPMPNEKGVWKSTKDGTVSWYVR